MEFKKPGYVFRIDDRANFQLLGPGGDLLWIDSNQPPLLPVGNRACIWGKPAVKHAMRNGRDVVTIELPTNTLYENPRVVLELKDDFVEAYFQGKVRRRFALSKWHVLAAGSTLNALECVDFRSHINSPAAYEVHQTVLGRRKLGTIGLDANTEDSDLMYAPHPMLFVFTNIEHSLVIAPMGLVNAESLQIKMVKGSTIIDDYHVRVGPSLYWLEAGETLASPHFMLVQGIDTDPLASLARYTSLLVREGLVKPKTQADLQDWWLSPMWCSWGDQHTHLDSDEVVHTAYTAEQRTQAVHNITERMVNRVVETILKHDLPVRTLILDDRWYTKQGDMYADTAKFPDLRGLVDRLHSRGFKVLCWASLYQWDKDSLVFQRHPEWFLTHHYHRNWHNPDRNIIHVDYSDPAVAQAYLGELMGRLLGGGEGCYNFDGIKFDWPFLIPHDYAYADRDWVGKEKTVYNTQKRVYQAAKAVKPEALIIGVSPHPFFNDTQDIIRTYDVSTFDIRIHMDRARYVRAITPGMTPAMDEHVYYQNFFRYVEEGSRLGIPMIYNLLRFNGDGVAYTDADYARLRKLLNQYVDNMPRLKKYLEPKA